MLICFSQLQFDVCSLFILSGHYAAPALGYKSVVAAPAYTHGYAAPAYAHHGFAAPAYAHHGFSAPAHSYSSSSLISSPVHSHGYAAPAVAYANHGMSLMLKILINLVYNDFRGERLTTIKPIYI